MDEKIVRFRRAFAVILLFLGAIFFFILRLQVVEGRRYFQLSEENRIRKVYIPAPRGKILDRNGIVLADSRPGFSVSVMPNLIDEETLNELARILKIEPSDIRDWIKKTKTPQVALKIKHDIDFGTLTKIEEKSKDMKGVIVSIEPLRHYPHGQLLCHVLGHVGEVTFSELAKKSDYRYGDFIGRMGVEEYYEAKLRGKDGISYIEVDAYGNELGPIAEKRPQPLVEGNDLRLALDIGLQESAAVYLAGYDKAAVVALKPSTGEVLVLYSKPGFDPNIFLKGLTKDEWNKIEGHPYAPLYDRAIMSGYPPGSAFKPFVALAGLETGLITPEKRFKACTGSFPMGNRVFHCWHAHHSQDLMGAITNSCDIYFYQLGLLVGVNNIYEVCKKVGLGEITGIDLPEEKKGLIPNSEWLDERYKKQWSKGHIMNLSIGQGEILITPIQLACAYTVFTNAGKIARPCLVFDGKSRQVDTRCGLKSIEIVRAGLEKVVEEGTGMLAKFGSFPVGGKTGTAQNPSGKDHSLFVGFSPIVKPEILVAVVVENAGHGGSVAAPVAGRLIEDYFNKYGQASR